MEGDSSRETLIGALRTATDDGLITAAGVRSPIWQIDLHYRYVIDGDAGELEVRIEEDDSTILSKQVWHNGEPAPEFYQRLVLAVRDAGADLGTGLNLSAESVEEPSKMLAEVVHLRSQELMGHRNSLRKIIERVDGWYFTERYVIPAEQLSYTIDVEDLGQNGLGTASAQQGLVRRIDSDPIRPPALPDCWRPGGLARDIQPRATDGTSSAPATRRYRSDATPAAGSQVEVSNAGASVRSVIHGCLCRSNARNRTNGDWSVRVGAGRKMSVVDPSLGDTEKKSRKHYM